MRRLRQKGKGTEGWESAGEGSTVEGADALQPQSNSAPAIHLHIEHLDSWGQQEVIELHMERTQINDFYNLSGKWEWETVLWGTTRYRNVKGAQRVGKFFFFPVGEKTAQSLPQGTISKSCKKRCTEEGDETYQPPPEDENQRWCLSQHAPQWLRGANLPPGIPHQGFRLLMAVLHTNRYRFPPPKKQWQ